MIKVAVLDDYQNIFEQIINVENYKEKFDFYVFKEKFEFYHLAGASFILTGIYLSNRKVND